MSVCVCIFTPYQSVFFEFHGRTLLIESNQQTSDFYESVIFEDIVEFCKVNF